jgi:creatinine amidohydrolase
MTAVRLDRLSWPQVRSGLLAVPLGSCEQHGPHLPFDVDTCVASAVTDRFAARARDVVVAPALPYGASGEHEGFAGTLSLGSEALAVLLVELGRSASRWAGRLLLVNGHGGNTDALVTATADLRAEGRDAAWWPCTVPGGDAHAGRTETSLMLALRPDVVQLDRAAPGRLEPMTALLPALRQAGVAPVSLNGVLGDPGGASAEEGERLLDQLAERLRSDVTAWQVRVNGRLGGTT